MLKPSFINIILYTLLKFIIIYIVFMIATSNFKLLQLNNIQNGSDLFYYLWLVLFIPVMNMLFFSVPFFLSFKIKSKTYFLITVVSIAVLEYLLYVYFTSQKYIDVKGTYIELISLGVFYLLFFKRINAIGKT